MAWTEFECFQCQKTFSLEGHCWGDVGGDRWCVTCAAAEVARLNTWAGLMSLLDKYYPADVFEGMEGEGPRIVVLVREVNRLQAQVALLKHEADCHLCQAGGCKCPERDELQAAADAVKGGE